MSSGARSFRSARSRVSSHTGRIAELGEEYLALGDNGQHREALPAGATATEIDAASAALGFDVPTD